MYVRKTNIGLIWVKTVGADVRVNSGRAKPIPDKMDVIFGEAGQVKEYEIKYV